MPSPTIGVGVADLDALRQANKTAAEILTNKKSTSLSDITQCTEATDGKAIKLKIGDGSEVEFRSLDTVGVTRLNTAIVDICGGASAGVTLPACIGGEVTEGNAGIATKKVHVAFMKIAAGCPKLISEATGGNSDAQKEIARRLCEAEADRGYLGPWPPPAGPDREAPAEAVADTPVDLLDAAPAGERLSTGSDGEPGPADGVVLLPAAEEPPPVASGSQPAAAAEVDGPRFVVKEPPAKPSFEEWTGKACDITKADPKQADELARKADIPNLDEYIEKRIPNCSAAQLERARRCIVASNLSLMGAEPPNTQEVKNLLEKFGPIIDMAINISAITTGDSVTLKHKLPENDETLKQYLGDGLKNLKDNTAVTTGLTYLHMMLEESKDLSEEGKTKLMSEIRGMLENFSTGSESIPEDPMAFTAKILAQINAGRIKKATSSGQDQSKGVGEFLLGVRIPNINVSSGDAVIALVDDIKRQTEELLKKKPEAPPSDGAGAAPAPVKPPASESAPREEAPDEAIVGELEPGSESESGEVLASEAASREASVIESESAPELTVESASGEVPGPGSGPAKPPEPAPAPGPAKPPEPAPAPEPR